MCDVGTILLSVFEDFLYLSHSSEPLLCKAKPAPAQAQPEGHRRHQRSRPRDMMSCGDPHRTHTKNPLNIARTSGESGKNHRKIQHTVEIC